MVRLPVIVGFGGVSPAGRSSLFRGYERLVIDALPSAVTDQTYRSLAAMMKMDVNGAVSAEQKTVYFRQYLDSTDRRYLI